MVVCSQRVQSIRCYLIVCCFLFCWQSCSSSLMHPLWPGNWCNVCTVSFFSSFQINSYYFCSFLLILIHANLKLNNYENINCYISNRHFHLQTLFHLPVWWDWIWFSIRFVKVLMVLLFIVAWPISKLLDCLLGHEHSTFFRRAGTSCWHNPASTSCIVTNNIQLNPAILNSQNNWVRIKSESDNNIQ